MCLRWDWKAQGQAFGLSFLADWLGFVGLRLFVIDSPWVLAQVGAAALFWVYTTRLAISRAAVGPIVAGAVLGAFVGLRWP